MEIIDILSLPKKEAEIKITPVTTDASFVTVICGSQLYIISEEDSENIKCFIEGHGEYWTYKPSVEITIRNIMDPILEPCCKVWINHTHVSSIKYTNLFKKLKVDTDDRKSF